MPRIPSRGRLPLPLISALQAAGKPGWLVGDALQGSSRARRRQAAALAAREPDIYAEVWALAARAAGAQVERGSGGFARLSRQGVTADVHLQETDLDGVVALRRAADRGECQAALEAAGVPMPAALVVANDDLRPALAFLERHGTVVVKPGRGTAEGAGVTTGIRSEADLRRAWLVASRWDRLLHVEEDVAGRVLRLLYLDGALLDAIERHPPLVVGDGRRRVLDLVDDENDRRLAAPAVDGGKAALALDLDAVVGGCDPSAIPEAGAEVTVKRVVNQNRPDENERLALDRLHPSVVEAGAAASAALGLRLCGVDLVTTDPGAALDAAGGVVLELNGTPGLFLHARHAGGFGYEPVVAAVLDRLLDRAR